MAEIIPRIGLLSTGDELTNGDILNTNSQQIARRLMDHQIQPGLHVTANDDQLQIEKAMRFLLAEHEALIITGGLGPTSDDRTRFALSAVLGKELVFDEASWQRIIERLQRLGLPVSENNRQQALFPRDAEIFSNGNGTAAGCSITAGEKLIFMLPGPPFECFPIFEEKVLPDLLKKQYARPLFRCEWLLLKVSEGDIALQLDPLAENSGCYVGYRVNPPYLEVKLLSPDSAALEKMRQIFDAIIGSKCISHKRQKASEQLREYLIKTQLPMRITDSATGGLIETALLTPQTYRFLHFTNPSENADAMHVTVSGLTAYWQNKSEPCQIQIEFTQSQKSHHTTLDIPFRKERTPGYALEIACWEIFRFLQSIK